MDKYAVLFSHKRVVPTRVKNGRKFKSEYTLYKYKILNSDIPVDWIVNHDDGVGIRTYETRDEAREDIEKSLSDVCLTNGVVNLMIYYVENDDDVQYRCIEKIRQERAREALKPKSNSGVKG